jgi:hypothetical protein
MAISTADLVVYRDQAQTLAFVAVGHDISTWTIRLTAARLIGRERQHEMTRLFAASAGKLFSVDATVVDGSAGTCEVALTAPLTAGLASSIYAYDIWRIDAGFEALPAVGRFVVGGVARLPA